MLHIPIIVCLQPEANMFYVQSARVHLFACVERAASARSIISWSVRLLYSVLPITLVSDRSLRSG